SLHHNEMRDLVDDAMREPHYKVEVEPLLQPLTGETLKYRQQTERKRRKVMLRYWGAKCDRSFLILRWFHLMPEVICTSGPLPFIKMQQSKVRVSRTN